MRSRAHRTDDAPRSVAASARRKGRPTSLLIAVATLIASAIAVGAPAAPARADSHEGAVTVSDIHQLAAAIAAANTGGPKVIYLEPGTYDLTASGFRAPLTIAAPGTQIVGVDPTTSLQAASFVIDGGTQQPGLVINADDVVVSGVTITRTARPNGSGAAITVRRNADRFVLADSSIEHNHARDGGAIMIEPAASATVQTSTFLGNTAVRKGGAIRVDGNLDLVNSTFTLNSAQSGGAISVAGSSAVSYSTFVDNLSNNQKGGGVDRNGGSLAITGSILTLADRPSADGSDCSGNPNLIGANYVGNAQGCNPGPEVLIGTQLGVPLGIQPLADNTGPTWTMAINGDSPAVDAALAADIDGDGDLECARIEMGGAFGSRFLDVDQRGIARPSDAGCDLGAFETGLVFDVSLTSDPIDPFVGAEYLDADEIGPAVVATDELLEGSLAASPLNAFPLNAFPIEAVPLNAFPLNAFPLNAFPLNAFPLNAFDADERGLTDYPLNAFPLNAFPLNAFPLNDLVLTEDACAPLRPGFSGPCTWEALLAQTDFAGVPLQSITVDDVIDDPVVGQMNLGAMNLEGTPLNAFPLSAFLLYNLPLNAFPLSAFPLNAFDGSGETNDICQALPVGFCGTTDDATLASVALAGLPLNAFPLSAFPLNAFPLNAFPLNAFPLNAFPLNAFRWEATPLNAFPLNAFPLSAFGTVIDCDPNGGSCPETLGEATFVDGSTLGGLAAALLASCGSLDPSSAVSLCIPGFPDDLSLADLLAGVIPPDSIPWEKIDLGTPGLQNAGPDDAWTFDYVVEFTVTDQAAVDIDLTLPPRFAYDMVNASTLDGAPITATAVACRDENSSDCVDESLVVSFQIPDVAPGTHELRVASRAGFRIEPATAVVDATATAGTSTADATDDHTVSVKPPPDRGALAIESVGSGCGTADGGVNLGWAASTDGVDFYTFNVTPAAAACGLRADIYLDNLPVDLDLTLYGERSAQLRGQPDSTMTYIDDVTLDLNPFDDVIQADTVQDIPQRLPDSLVGVDPENFAVVAISSNRDQASDRIRTGTLRPGRYVIQVSAYNGAESNDPYALRIRTDGSVTPRACDALDLTGVTSTRALPTTLPDGVNTLFLVNERMLTYQFGSTGRDEVLAALDGPNGLANQPEIGVLGAVIPVDADLTAVEADDASAGAAAALAARYEKPCDPFLSNAVVEEIGEVIDRYTSGHDTIKNIVIVGDDQQIPMANIVDDANFANERTYSQEFGAGESNESTAALSAGMYRSDDPYGTDAGIQVRDHELYVPTRAVGRLVETKVEIVASIQNFITFGGRLDPGTARDAFQSGYEFLADGASLNADLLDAAGYEVDDELINDTWTDDQLQTKLQNSDLSVIGIHAHFDHDDALPAADNFAAGPDDLFNTSELPNQVDRAIVYSMGCHSGWSLSDVQVGGPAPTDPAPDWAQTVSGSGRNVFAGNTGFGYGDTAVVALTEQLTADFAAEIGDDGPIGQAWVNAKQKMVSEILVLDAYQEKAVQQFVFYGLPMFHVGVDPEPVVAETSNFSRESLTAAAEGVTTVQEIEVSAALPGQGAGALGMSEFGKTTSNDGSFYDVDGRTLDVNGHPIQPIYVEDLPEQAGSVARDALITELTSVDDPDGDEFDPVFFWASANYGPTDSSGDARPEFFDGSFPAEMAAVRDLVIDGDERQEVVFAAGQYKASDDEPDVGTQRLHTRVKADVYYVSEDDVDLEPPLIMQSVGEVVDGTGGNLYDASFTVEVVDAERVYVLYRGVGVAQWDGFDLAETGSGTWTGSQQFFGGTERMEYIVQAVRNGNVAMSNAKSRYFLADTDAQISSMFLTSPQVDPGETRVPCTNADWYNGVDDVDVFAAYDAPSGPPQQFEARTRVNAGAVATTTFDESELNLVATLDADGVHVVSALDETGAFDSCTVRIDRTDPEVSITPTTPPNESGWFTTDSVDVEIDASDATSGVAGVVYDNDSQSGTVGPDDLPLQTQVSGDGIHPVSATATDVAGNDANASLDVRIDTTPPQVVVTVPTAPVGVGENVTLRATCSDPTPGSGLASCVLNLEGPDGPIDVTSGTFDPITGTFTFSFAPDAFGTYTVSVIAQDVAGLTATKPDPNESPIQFDVTDAEAPTIAITPNPAAGTWSKTPIDVTITALDNDQVASLTYVVVAAAAVCPATTPYATSYTTGFNLGEGQHKVCAAATDRAGNTATANATIQVDRTAPTATLNVSRLILTTGTDAAGVNFTCSDDLSGIRPVDGCTVTVTKDGAPFATWSSSPQQLGPGLQVGTYVLTLTATDRAGNAMSVSKTVTVLRSLCVRELYDSTQSKNIGTNYTIKIELCDTNLPKRLVLEATSITRTVDGVQYAPGPNDSGSSNNLFEFRFSGKDGYIYNLNTTGLNAALTGPEQFTLDFVARDGNTIIGTGRARFTLRP